MGWHRGRGRSPMHLFRNRHFNALFFGRLFTNIGDSVYYIAMMWMVLKLGGNSTVYTGFAGFLFSLTEVLSLFYGPVLDKINAKKLLVTASVLQAGLLLFLVVLSKYGIMNVWLLLLSIPVLSFLSELTYPLESVLLPKAVEKKDLVKANSLMSIAYKGSDFFFNGIAGFILAAFSMSMVLGMNSLLFILSSILFLFLKVQVKRSKQTGSVREEWQAYKRDFKEGISFVKQPFILQLLIPLLFLNFFFAIVMVVLPSFANTTGEGASSYGIMTAALGLGALAGAAGADKISRIFPFGKILAAGFLLSGLSWLFMILLSNVSIWYVYTLMFISELSIGAINVLFSAIFQQLPDEQMLGRVNTINVSLLSLAMPAGSLIGGVMAKITSVQLTMSFFGIGLFVLALFYMLSKRMRELPKVMEIDHTYVKLSR